MIPARAVLTPILSSPPRMWGRGQGEGAFSRKHEIVDITPVIKAPLTFTSPPASRVERKVNRGSR
jgi:hypothetical protein